MTIHEAGVRDKRVGHLDLDYQTMIPRRSSDNHDGTKARWRDGQPGMEPSLRCCCSFVAPSRLRAFAIVSVALILVSSVTPERSRLLPPRRSRKSAKAAKPAPPTKEQLRLAALKKDAAADIDGLATLTQQMVDSVFSFGELGFQEIESSRYLTGILEQHGFKITRGISGIPTAWVAEWGSGKPVIALGSDIDGIPQGSQKPGVAYRDPLVEGAPGHGEGHNSGIPLNITAAIAVKKLMEREKLPGTLRLWPGVAEELVGAKAWYVRDGMFKDVDISLVHARRQQVRHVVGRAAGHRAGLDRVHVHRSRPRTAPARRGAARARSTRSS